MTKSMHITKIKVLSSIVGNQHIRECDFSTFQIDKHAYGATRERAIFHASDRFPVDGKGKRIATSKDPDCVDVTCTMALLEFMPKYLRPELRPGISSWPLAIIVLVEPVLAAIVIEDLKAIKGAKCLVALGFLAVTQDHAKRIISAGIIAFNLLHG